MTPLLEANLQEFYYALSNENMPLVASPVSKRIYYSKAGLGRVWRVFFIIWSRIFGEKFKKERLERNIKKTDELFASQLKLMEKKLEKLEKQLVMFLEEDCSFSKKKFEKYQWMVCRWNDTTEKFLKVIDRNYKQKNETFSQVLQQNFLTQLFYISKKTEKKFKEYQNIINIERTLGKKTPYPILKKLSQKKNLLDSEEKILHQWIKKVNEPKEMVSVRVLHKGLLSFVKQVKKTLFSPHVTPPSVSQLEFELVRRNIKIFHTDDDKHLVWRDSLASGSSVFCNEKEWIIDNEVANDRLSGADHNKIFTVKQEPEKVICIGRNQAILPIKSLIAKEYGSLVHHANWHEVDKSGSVAVLERLKKPLSQIEWVSEEESISKEDRLRARPIVNQIKWFIEKKQTPKMFLVKFFMFSRQNVLKSTKPMIEEKLFDYLALIRFAWKCSKKNRAVFKFIVSQSGLAKHLYASFFKEAIKGTFKAEEIDPADLALRQRFQIVDSDVIDQAKKLQLEAKNIVIKCIKKTSKELKVKSLDEVSAFVKKQLIAFYEFDHTISFIDNDMKKRLWNVLKKRFS